MSRSISIVLALVVLWMPGPASAQTVEGGAKGGVSFSDIPKYADLLEDEGATDVKTRTGAVVGGFVAIPLGTSVAFQPEMLFVQRGLRASPFTGQTAKINLDYIDVPLLIRVGPGAGRGFHVLAGPSINFLTKAWLIEEGADPGRVDIEDDVEAVDYGIVVGAGYYGSLLLLEGRFEEGLRSVSRFSDDDEESFRNRTLMILTGIRFGR